MKLMAIVVCGVGLCIAPGHLGLEMIGMEITS